MGLINLRSCKGIWIGLRSESRTKREDVGSVKKETLVKFEVMKNKKRRQKPELLLNKLWDEICPYDQEEMAEYLECDQSTVSRMYSTYKVSKKMKMKIEKLTDGYIKKGDWLPSTLNY